jgi:hypothetical protein
MRREAPIQRAIVQYLRAVLPGAIIHHARGEINKRGKGIAIELAQAKANGALAGFPDLVVLPFAHIGPCFFEVKAEGNYATPAQKALHAQLEALGYRIAVVRSIDDVRERLAGWGIWTKDKQPAQAALIEMRGTIK